MSKPPDQACSHDHSDEPAGAAPGGAGDDPPTYQDVLDEALEETFPASDPIAPAAAERANEQIVTEKNAVDWQLEPGSKAEPGRLPEADGSVAVTSDDSAIAQPPAARGPATAKPGCGGA